MHSQKTRQTAEDPGLWNGSVSEKTMMKRRTETDEEKRSGIVPEGAEEEREGR